MAADRPAPEVVLCIRPNPWSETITDDELVEILLAAAKDGERELITEWIKMGQAGPSAVCAQVIFDPTNPRSQTTAESRVLAVITYGDRASAAGCQSFALAIADHAERLGPGQTGDFCRGNGDIIVGQAAYYEKAISASYGLEVSLDHTLSQYTLELVMNAVDKRRNEWRKKNNGFTLAPPKWYNRDDLPGSGYRHQFVIGRWRPLPRSGCES